VTEGPVDAATVLVRPVVPGDLDALDALLSSLDDQSRYRRWFTGGADVHRAAAWAAHPEQQDAVGLVATTADGRLVGHAADSEPARADQTLADAAATGIDLAAITATLEREGVQAFCKSYHQLLDCIEGKLGALDRRSPTAQRVLVLTNEDLADANEVPESIRPLLDAAEEVYVVAPTLTTWMQWLADDRDSALVAADERLRTVFDHMRAGGLEPHGEIGAENQVTAITDALARFDADLIVLRLHAPGSEHENWSEHRIAKKVRSHFDVATVVFYFDSEGLVVERDEA